MNGPILDPPALKTIDDLDWWVLVDPSDPRLPPCVRLFARWLVARNGEHALQYDFDYWRAVAKPEIAMQEVRRLAADYLDAVHAFPDYGGTAMIEEQKNFMAFMREVTIYLYRPDRRVAILLVPPEQSGQVGQGKYRRPSRHERYRA